MERNDISDWFIENYPEDIFDGSSGDVGAVAIKHILMIVKGCRRR